MDLIQVEKFSIPDAGDLQLHEYTARRFLDYAISVVKGRALADVSDGLKPVHRRILHAMNRLSITATSKHRKVALVVGETMGKYHPHGDQSIADALVRMAQEFSLRYPLIDGQGNFGSRDGDGAAAMRYIECRLTPFSELLLSEIDMGTVDFQPSYDGSNQEPLMLPARLPMVLLNGSSGIAVGYASEIPSHNMREVAAAACRLIREPESTIDDILEVLPAPDFPSGGQIINSPQSLRDIYETGRGSVRMRSRWRKEELARGQWRIVVYEMPHDVSTRKVLEEIEIAVNPQIKTGKKELTQDQKNLKQLLLSVLDTAKDEACKDEPIRLVLEPKSSKQSVDDLMAILLSHTSLEAGVAVNMTMIGRDGNPKAKSLRTILTEWIDFRFVTVERRLRYRLDKVDKRLHILAGRVIAYLNLDAVIRTIREADEPKSALIAAFGLSEIQAEDILEIRLRQLARLENIKLEAEIAELEKEAAHLNHLLVTPSAFKKLILTEIESDAKKYGDDRRSLVEPVESIRQAEISVSDEPATVILSKNGWIRARMGHGIDKNSMSYKQGDSERVVLESRTTQTVIVIDTNGRAYSIKVSDLPMGARGDGVPITTMMELQPGENGMGQVAHILADKLDVQYFFTNSAGYGFISSLDKLVGRNKAGKAFMTIGKGERVLTPAKVAGDAIAAICEGGKEQRLLVFARDEMKVLPGGRGVIVMALGTEEVLSVAGVVNSTSINVVGESKSVTIAGADLEKYTMKRARKGCQIPGKFKAVGVE
jgi:topoisomerase-4 subunit A